jgi:two-component system nitrate/nitrite sensor histidine kinase NarX
MNSTLAHPTSLPDPLPGQASAATALLAEITADLSSGADIRALLRRFLEPIIQLAQARAGAVRLLGDDETLRMVSELGLPPHLGCAERTVGRHCGSCGKAVDGGELTWSPQLSECAGNTQHLLTPLGFNHMLAVPLGHRGRVLGVYNLFFDQTKGPSAKVKAMLRSVGDLLGLALDNARLETENLRAVVMQERQMMAAEVHDAVAQDLTFLRMRVPLLEQAIAEHDDARTAQFMAELRDALGHAHGSLREIITQFRTPPNPQGLAQGLRTRVDEFASRSGVQAALDNRCPELNLPPALETQVLYIASEALTNVNRHAHATQAWVTLSPTAAGQVQLRVADNGQGLPQDASAPGHHGLAIMSERARRLGGQVSLQPRDSGGTMVTLTFPLPTTSA